MSDDHGTTAICCHCGKMGTIDTNLIQVGTSDFDRRWIHDICWEEWYTKKLRTLHT